MFDSGQFQQKDKFGNDRVEIVQQQNFITAAVFFVLITSLLYYIMVFVSELAPSFAVSVAVCFRRSKPGEREDDLDDDVVLDAKGNPAFNNPEVSFGNTKELEARIEAAQKELNDAKKNNLKLRGEIRAAKEAEQLKNTDVTRTAVNTRKKGKKKKFGAQQA